MFGLFIAIFFGWAGGYQFYLKKKNMGILYLCTFGLFGIGWIIDIVKAYKAFAKKHAIQKLLLFPAPNPHMLLLCTSMQAKQQRRT